MDIFEIGEEVKRARQALGMTQEQVAGIAGISRVRLVQLENGAINEMKFGNVLAVLSALDLTLRVGADNGGRPVLEDLQKDQEERPGF